jgi:hypothetical protein
LPDICQIWNEFSQWKALASLQGRVGRICELRIAGGRSEVRAPARSLWRPGRESGGCRRYAQPAVGGDSCLNCWTMLWKAGSAWTQTGPPSAATWTPPPPDEGPRSRRPTEQALAFPRLPPDHLLRRLTGRETVRTGARAANATR